MGQPSQRGLDTPDDDRYAWEEPLEDLRIGLDRIVGAESRLPAGRIGIVAAQADVGRVVVDHRVHGSGRDSEKEPRCAELGEVAQVVPPVGLRDNGYTIPFGLEQPPDDGGTEGRMVDVGIPRKEDHVQFVPSACTDLLECSR